MRIIITGFALTISGCGAVVVHDHHDQGYGPPPHAPAHGYRHKYQNHYLEYDSHLGVYLIIGVPNTYFIDGIYYRESEQSWHASHYIDRDWKEYHAENLPPGLYKKYKSRGKSYKHDDKRMDHPGKSHRGDDD